MLRTPLAHCTTRLSTHENAPKINFSYVCFGSKEYIVFKVCDASYSEKRVFQKGIFNFVSNLKFLELLYDFSGEVSTSHCGFM